MGVKRPEKGSKWRLWREHATYLQTAQLLYQYAGGNPVSVHHSGVMAKIAAHESSEKNRRKTISYNNLRRKLGSLNFCQNRRHVACRSILTSCRVRSAGTGSAHGSDGGPNKQRAWGVGRGQVGCVAKTHRDAERCVIARSTHSIGSRPSPAGARPGSTPRWNQGDPPCSFRPGPPGPRQGWAAGSDRFWLCELRISQHFSTFYGPSVQAMDTQLGAGSTADSDDSTRWRATNTLCR